VNRARAQQILLLHRPGAGDERDPELAEALGMAERDEELRRWFMAQRNAQDAIRRGFRSIAPPAALKEQIISERPWHTRPVTLRHVMATAAVALVVLALGLWWSGEEPREDKSFASYRNRMVSTALRGYGMQLETSDLKSIRDFLNQRGAPADFVPPTGLAQATGTGCLTVAWQASRVSMICFKTGRPLPPGQSSDLWFFVVDHAVVPDAPATDTPQLARVREVATASWTRAGKTYVLAVQGDEMLLRKFL
jgi:hypothetical protein